MKKQFWLVKSEADCYSIDEFKKDKQTSWTGIRNYQSRNFMKDGMSLGDFVFYYHSGGDDKNPTGIYGLAKVSSKPHPDETQFQKYNEYFDPKATKEKPIWFCVDIKFVKKFKVSMTLAQIKFDPKLKGIPVAQKGSRLSVQPVSVEHGEYLLKKFS